MWSPVVWHASSFAHPAEQPFYMMVVLLRTAQAV